MKLKPKDRPHAGFRSEDGTARALKRKGHSVKALPRNNRNADMQVDGKNVEVKAAVETEYKGSDGYPIRGFVFSNMKKNPKTDKYILKCMSPDRSKVLKQYEIPAGKVKQRTLTITRNSKYEGFKKNAFRHAQPMGYEDPRKNSFSETAEEIVYEGTGMAIGAIAGIISPALLQMVRGENANIQFQQTVGMLAGGMVGRGMGRTALEMKRSRRNDNQRRMNSKFR